jgi:hypothetical protein
LKLDNNFSAINNGKNVNYIDDKDCINVKMTFIINKKKDVLLPFTFFKLIKL